LLLAPVLVVPLGLQVISIEGRIAARLVWAFRRLAPAGAATAIVAFLIPTGLLSGLVAAGWFLVCAVGALAGILLKMCWPTAPRSVGVPLYLLLGWVAVWYTGTILHNAGVAAMVLLFVGGALYSIGGILYAFKWPDPWPSTFGYHEFFHACTAVAAICHYIAMWFVVF